MLCKAGGHYVHVLFNCPGDKFIYYIMCMGTALTQYSSSGSLNLMLRESDRYENSNQPLQKLLIYYESFLEYYVQM